MNIVMWMLAGAILGWIGFTYLRFNEGRGMMISVIIGAVGGLVGGNMIAPLFTATTVPGAFSSSALIFAGAAAAAFLAAGNMIYNKWGV
jgi:uncharacterized membrane protein YeaQ/YmgE (transglycosylase-associated protein family)